MAVTINGSTGVDYADGIKQKFGTSGDLEIFHDGSYSKVKTGGSSHLFIQADYDANQWLYLDAGHTIELRTTGYDTAVKCNSNGSVELYYNSIKTFATESDGIAVIGSEGGNAFITFKADEGDDNADLFDVGVYDGGPFTIQNKASGSWETNIECNGNGNVELYYDNAKVFETLEYGARIKRPSGGSTDLEVIGCEGQDAYVHLYADDGDNSTDKFRIGSIASDNTFRIDNYSDHAWETNIRCDGHGDDGSVRLYRDNSVKLLTTSGGVDIGGWVRPTTDDYWDCGHPSYRWDDIRATNSTIQTSDKNEKNTIVDSDLGLSFVNKLKPVSYKFNGKTRTHYGLIAQDVETVITDLGKTTTQFAPLIKDTLEDGTERYGLRYGEFISPLIKAVQELSAEVETLKTKVAALEGG